MQQYKSDNNTALETLTLKWNALEKHHSRKKNISWSCDTFRTKITEIFFWFQLRKYCR